jgi:cytoskeleton protein RodZ
MMRGNQGGRVIGKTELMGSFGENLRRERELRGVTLEEISAATKISVRFLNSIENEEFSRLPGGIFNRSFVRAYVRYLGLDEDPLLEEYQLAAKTKGEVDLTQFSPLRIYSRPERRSHYTPWAVMIAVGLLAIGISLWRYSHRTVQIPSVAEQVPPARSSLASQPETDVSAGPSKTVRAAATSSVASHAGGNTPPAKTGPATGGVLAVTSSASSAPPKLPPVTDTDGRLVLQIATTERAWMAIDVDGTMVMQGTVDPNTVKTFKADASFDVLTGNAQGVILTLNGQTMKPLGREGEVKQIHLTWDNLKKPASQ